MPNDTTTAVQQPPKAHLGLPTTRWLRPNSFDKYSCSYAGQWSSPTHPGHFHHDLLPTTLTDREQRLLSSRVITNASSSKPRAPSVTPPIAHATCRNPDHTWNVYSVQKSPVKRKPQPRTYFVHTQASAMNRQLWLRQVLSAPGAKRPSQKKTRNSKFR